MTVTRAQKTKKNTEETHTNEKTQQKIQTAASNTGRTTRSTHKPRESTPPKQPNLQEGTPQHRDCIVTDAAARSPAAKHLLKENRNQGGKASAQAERGGKASTRRHDQLKEEVTKHPPIRTLTSKAAKHPPD